MDIGPTELIIILIIVVLVFGVGRVGKLGGELGSAIREFRHGLGGDKDKPADVSAQITDVQDAVPAAPASAAEPVAEANPNDALKS